MDVRRLQTHRTQRFNLEGEEEDLDVVVIYATLVSPNGGSRNLRRNVLEFGRTFVVMPKGTHRATIVWLHGIGEKGSSIKWICPSAPTRQVTLFGGYPCTAWFNMESMSEDACDDLEGLDASATHVANLLISDPDDGMYETRDIKAKHDTYETYNILLEWNWNGILNSDSVRTKS
ncbi:hypothetical protein Lser_V15G46144 [Lactuca serriola]